MVDIERGTCSRHDAEHSCVWVRIGGADARAHLSRACHQS